MGNGVVSGVVVVVGSVVVVVSGVVVGCVVVHKFISVNVPPGSWNCEQTALTILG